MFNRYYIDSEDGFARHDFEELGLLDPVEVDVGLPDFAKHPGVPVGETAVGKVLAAGAKSFICPNDVDESLK